VDDFDPGMEAKSVERVALSRAERRLDDIARLVSDWIWETDRELRITHVSDRMFEQLEFHPKEITGQPFSTFARFDAETDEDLLEQFRKPFRHLETKINDRSGNPHTLLISSVPIFDEETGEFLGARGTAEDITDKLAAELALSESETLHRSLVELSPVAIVVIRNSRIIYANPAAERLFGSDENPQLPETIALDVIHPDDHAIVRGMKASNYPSEPQEIRHIRLDGTEFFGTNSVAKIEWNGEPAVMVVIQDVSELKWAEAKIEESENRFRDFARSAADRFWETDEHHRFTFLSASNSRESILPQTVALGKCRWELSSAHQSGEFWASHKADLDAHRPFRNFRFQLTDQEGIVHYLKSNGDPIYDKHENFKGYRGTTVEETEEVLTRRKMEDVQGQFFSSMDQLEEGFAIWDANERFVYCNSYFAEAHIAARATFSPGRSFEEFLAALSKVRVLEPGEERDQWLVDRLQAYRQGNYVHELEIDGRWVRIRKNTLGDGSSVFTYADIHDSKLKEQQLEENEYKLRTITNQMPAFIAYNDKDLIYRFANENFRKLGLNPEDIIGKHVTEVLGKKTYLAVKDHIDKALGGEAVTYDNEIMLRTGKVITTTVSIIPDKDETDEVIGLFVLSMDITERKETEREIAESKASLDVAQRIAQMGSWERDLSSDNLRWSDEHYRLFGLDPVAEKISYEKFVAMIHPEDRPRVTSSVKQQIETRQKKASNEFRIIRSDGLERVVHGDAELNFDKDGNPIRLVGTTQDITAQNRVQSALEAAKLEAEFANRAKSEFLSSMSHELRTPMNAVLGYAQLLLQNKKEALSELQQKHVGQVLKSGQHLLQLINDILDLSKVESGQFSIALEDVEIAPIVAECVELVASQAARTNILITDQTAGDTTSTVKADHTRLKQAILNLLSNAIKYNTPGGTVTVSCEKIDPNRLRVSVEDSGIGIAEDLQNQIFEPFSRLGADRRGIEGTGIGLTITKQIIESMGGEIAFRSSEGKGSKFWLDLLTVVGVSSPLQEKRLHTDLSSPHLADDSQKRVLLYIEDDRSNLELMKEVIDHFPNLAMLSALTGEEGLELALAERPDVIVVDINLPGIDGFTVLEELGKNESTSASPVIALSAAAMTNDVAKGIEAGFFSYLTKPFNIDEVMTTIDAALEIEAGKKASGTNSGS